MALPDIIVIIKYLVIRHIAKQNKNINLELFPPNNPSSPLFSKTNIFSHKSSDSSIRQINTSKH